MCTPNPAWWGEVSSENAEVPIQSESTLRSAHSDYFIFSTNDNSRANPLVSPNMKNNSSSPGFLLSSEMLKSIRSTPREGLIIFDPHSLNVSQLDSAMIKMRNALARNNPETLAALILESIRARTNREGTYCDGRDVVHFTQSIIPFHLICRILCGKTPVYHLVSGRCPKISDPVSYAAS